MKRQLNTIALTVISAGVCLMLTGCFSYTKETSHSTVPAAEVPPESSSTTTTTTSSDDGTVQRDRQTTTTYP